MIQTESSCRTLDRGRSCIYQRTVVLWCLWADGDGNDALRPLSLSLSPTIISRWFQFIDQKQGAFSAEAHMCGAHRITTGHGMNCLPPAAEPQSARPADTLQKTSKNPQNATRLKDRLRDGLVEDDQVWERRRREGPPPRLIGGRLNNTKSNSNQIKANHFLERIFKTAKSIDWLEVPPGAALMRDSNRIA